MRLKLAEALALQLKRRLTRLKAYRPGHGQGLAMCIRQVHLRPDLAVLFLYLFVEPDVLEVKMQWQDGEGRDEERVFRASSNTGGWPSSLGISRRLEILTQVVTRKIVRHLENTTQADRALR